MKAESPHIFAALGVLLKGNRSGRSQIPFLFFFVKCRVLASGTLQRKGCKPAGGVLSSVTLFYGKEETKFHEKHSERRLSLAFSERPLDGHSPEILESRSFHVYFLNVRRTIAKSVWAEIKTAFATGSVSLRELARQMNIPEGTVLARAKREGWTRQIQNAKALANREETPLAVTPVEAVAMSMQQRGERHLGRMANVVEKTLPHIEAMEPGAILDRIDDVDTLDKIGRRTFRLDDNPLPAGFTLNVLNINSLNVEIDDKASVQ